MRLNPFNTDNIDVRSSGGGGGGGFPGGAGGVGCGTLILAAVAAIVFGIDPIQTIGVVQGVQQSGQQAAPTSTDEQSICTSNQYATEACNALQSLNQTWGQTFQQQGYGEQFKQPALNLFSGQITTACGPGSASMGPFYCPGDQTIYIDTSFYDQLNNQLGAPGDFARYYVIAHEYGHHVQTITGISDQIRSAQQQNPRQQNQLQVLMELQADCYAGVWAGKNRNLIEPGDMEEGMTAAAAIGDDTLTQGRVSSENFTHGTSQQRSQALRLGLQGDDKQCDRITALR